MHFHFSGALFASLLVLIIGASLLIFSLISHQEKEERLFQKLMDNENPDHLNNEFPYKAKQERQDLQKDLLFTQKGDHLQLRLMSAQSELILDRHDGQTEIIEHMLDVKCYMQEELFYVLPDGTKISGSGVSGAQAMQTIRYLEAAAASYYYKQELFKAENVKISRYVVPGHKLSDFNKTAKLLMDGMAQAVEFSLAGKDLNFKAHQLKAKFDPSEKLF